MAPPAHAAAGSAGTSVGGGVLAPAPGPRPAPARAGSPHGGAISLVAVADTGDAAFTIDDLGDARVWPRLDGSREPVPVRGIASAAQVAIARTHGEDGLLVALRDTAGDVAIVRLGADGAEHGRAQLPGSVRYDQVVLVGDVVLARRSDQVIGRFDSHGVLRGSLSALPGQQIATLATRAGAAVAITGDTDHGFHTLRELDLGDGAHWGHATELPHPTTTRVALSPSHHRLAVQSALDTGIEIYDLTTTPPTSLGGVAGDVDILPSLGFIDEDHLAVARGKLDWWMPPAAKHTDPWAAASSSLASVDATVEAAVGDGVFVTGGAGTLALANVKSVHWLGYRVLAETRVATDGAGHFVIGPSGGQVLWLDGSLRQTRALELPGEGPDSNAANAYILDASHLIMQRVTQGITEIDLVDADRTKDVVHIAKYPGMVRLDVDLEQRVVVATASDTRADRFKIDPVAMKFTALAPLVLKPGVQRTFVTDPARADGIAALTIGARDDGYHVDAYQETPSATTPIKPMDRGTVVPSFVLADGTTYNLGTTGGLEIHHGKAVEKPTLAPGLNASGLNAISHDAQTMILFADHEVVAIDAHGAVRWRMPVWQMGTAVFSADDRELALATLAGLIAVDAISGKPIASVCGWQFGLWDKAFPDRELGVVPVCAE